MTQVRAQVTGVPPSGWPALFEAACRVVAALEHTAGDPVLVDRADLEDLARAVRSVDRELHTAAAPDLLSETERMLGAALDLHDGVRRIYRATVGRGLLAEPELAAWLMTPNPRLSGAKPLSLVLQGDAGTQRAIEALELLP